MLKIFIKIPFLNYVSTINTEVNKLEKLEDLIVQELSVEQHSILNKILNVYNPNDMDLELFISLNQDNE